MTYGNLRKAYGNLKEAYKNNKKDDDSELIHILSLMQDDNKNWTILAIVAIIVTKEYVIIAALLLGYLLFGHRDCCSSFVL